MTKTMKTLRALLYYISASVCFGVLGTAWLVIISVGLEPVSVMILLHVIAIAWGVFAVAMRPREI